MPGKPKSRNWNDVQTAIATVAIVTTLGMWNLFASPSKVVKTAETSEPVLPPPPTEPPVEVEPSRLRCPRSKSCLLRERRRQQLSNNRCSRSSSPPRRKRRIRTTIIAADLYQSRRQKLPKMLRRLEFHAMGCDMLAVLESNVLSQTLPASHNGSRNGSRFSAASATTVSSPGSIRLMNIPSR